jgi:cytochrome c oxidase subunit II
MNAASAYGRIVVLGLAMVTAGWTPPIAHAQDEKATRPAGSSPATGATRVGTAPRVVEITAKRFEFTPKEITLKQGEPVTLRLTTEDVTHGFYMKKLGIDAVIEPGPPTEVTFTPQEAGTFTTICDHFCGEGHGNMHMKIIVE